MAIEYFINERGRTSTRSVPNKKSDTRPLGASHSWAKTPGTYIAGHAAIDGADHIAHQMELKWGAGRLRLLVPPNLREKFDRQRYLLNQAIWHGDLEAVRREAARMVAAWQALDKAAIAAGRESASPAIMEAVASIIAARSISDPLDALRDTAAGLNDPLEDLISTFGA